MSLAVKHVLRLARRILLDLLGVSACVCYLFHDVLIGLTASRGILAARSTSLVEYRTANSIA